MIEERTRSTHTHCRSCIAQSESWAVLKAIAASTFTTAFYSTSSAMTTSMTHAAITITVAERSV